MRSILTLAFGALILAACTTGLDRRTFLNGMVGVTEADLVRQLGVPSRTFETGGHKFLAYEERRTEYLPASPFFFGGGFGGRFGGGFWGPGYGFGGGVPAEVIPRRCETTFDIFGGRVQSWALRGNACG